VTGRLVETAIRVLGARHSGRHHPGRHHPGTCLALAALLCTSLATADETATTGAGAPPPSPKAASPSASTPSASTPSTSSTSDDGGLAWTAIGLGGGLLAVSVWQWIVFAKENSKAGDVCPARRGGMARCADAAAQSQYLTARDDAKGARTLAAIFGGLGAASIVTGILLFPDSDSGAGQPSVAISADPFAGEARAGLSWTW
jgi:hypothetical protein